MSGRVQLKEYHTGTLSRLADYLRECATPPDAASGEPSNPAAAAFERPGHEPGTDVAAPNAAVFKDAVEENIVRCAIAGDTEQGAVKNSIGGQGSARSFKPDMPGQLGKFDRGINRPIGGENRLAKCEKTKASAKTIYCFSTCLLISSGDTAHPLCGDFLRDG